MDSAHPQETIDTVVKMVRSAARITGIPHISEDGSLLHGASRFDIAKPVQMSVVMPLPARPKHANHVAAQHIFANFEDYTVCSAEHGTTKRRKDIDSFVTPVIAPRSAPGIFQIS